ncbi:hypothetical protein SEA_ODAY_57 [Gordonia phage ODay]|nr:hypothetical protein SEA_ODAY_57 [Gordonia phage ODay]
MSDASDSVENDTEFQLQACDGCGHTRRAHHPGAYHNADQRAIHHSCRPPCPCSDFVAKPIAPLDQPAVALPEPDVAEPSHLRFAADILDSSLGQEGPRSAELRRKADRMEAESADAELVRQLAAVAQNTLFTVLDQLGIRPADVPAFPWESTMWDALRAVRAVRAEAGES